MRVILCYEPVCRQCGDDECLHGLEDYLKALNGFAWVILRVEAGDDLIGKGFVFLFRSIIRVLGELENYVLVIVCPPKHFLSALIVNVVDVGVGDAVGVHAGPYTEFLRKDALEEGEARNV